MIDRERIRSLAVAIREHAEILEGFAAAPDVTPRMVELEALGRADLIEGRLAQLREVATLPVFERSFTSTVGSGTVRVLPDRPTGNEAA